MREFKFRIWDMDREAMLGSQHVIFYDGDFYENYRDLEDGIPIENIAVMQSAGLKDKNGVQIFEGDIVSMVVFEDNAEYLGDVVFENGCFCLNISLDGTEYKITALEWKETETIITVIGNIYENPDLLEESKKD